MHENTDYIWFQIEYNSKRYELNLFDVISAIIFVSEKGYIPKIPKSWIADVCKQYPYLEADDFPILKDNQVALTEVIALNVPDDDAEYFYFVAEANDTKFEIPLHLLLQLLLELEKAKFTPKLDYYSFWEDIEDMYYNYFEWEGTQESIICANLRARQIDL